MKKHTDAYFQWVNSDLECLLQHREWVTEDREIDVRVRKDRFGDIQIFTGVYDDDGDVRMEEYEPDLKVSSLEVAMAWGIEKSKSAAGLFK